MSARPKPFVVALTGGIASGKTTVSRMFEDLGAPVIDTDLIARDLVQRGSPLLTQIEAAFGAKVLDDSGALRRRAMRELIVRDAEKRSELERILHPAILREVETRIQAVTAPYCIVVVPLLAEIGVPRWVDRVLLVDAPRSVRVERLKARDDMTHREAVRFLEVQAEDRLRKKIAQDMVTNDRDLGEVRENVKRLHQTYSRGEAGHAGRMR